MVKSARFNGIPGRCLPGQESEEVSTDALSEKTGAETGTSCTILWLETAVVSSDLPAVNPGLL